MNTITSTLVLLLLSFVDAELDVFYTVSGSGEVGCSQQYASKGGRRMRAVHTRGSAGP